MSARSSGTTSIATISAPASSARWASSGPDSSSLWRRETVVETVRTAACTAVNLVDRREAQRGGAVGERAPPDDQPVAQLPDEGDRVVGHEAAAARVDAAQGDDVGRRLAQLADGDVELLPVALDLVEVGAHAVVAVVGRADRHLGRRGLED